MTQLKCAVISCPGLGDGLISLVLSNNMHLNGWEVVTYHEKHLMQLQSWFPHLPICFFPFKKDISHLFDSFDKIFASYSSTSFFMQKLIEERKKKDDGKLIILNPSFSKNFGKQPFYEDTLFSSNRTVVRNIENFCLKILHLPKCTKSNGLIVPYKLTHKKNKKRVVIHPTGSKKGKCWDPQKYVKLALQLKKRGFSPVFVMSEEEKKQWEWIIQQGLVLRSFLDIDSLAQYLYESAYMIGNDSGLGHLASSLNLPTLSLFRNHRCAKIWKPDWSENITLYPSRLIPNWHGWRFRDKNWQKFISVKKVLQAFERLVQSSL